MASPISIAGFDRLRDPVATVPFPSVLLVLHSAVRSRPDYTCAVAIMRVVREYDTHTHTHTKLSDTHGVANTNQ
jgi:hypothetical protein